MAIMGMVMAEDAAAPDERHEITEAMIQAGMEELDRYNPDYSDDEKAVAKIFKAMMDAKRLTR